MAAMDQELNIETTETTQRHEKYPQMTTVTTTCMVFYKLDWKRIILMRFY